MNMLTALVLAIPNALQSHRARESEYLEFNSKKAASKRIRARKKRASGLTRDEELQVDRDRWLQEVLEALRSVESLTTSELGRQMGTPRTTAYRRLITMEQGGYVYRTGEGVSTRWWISEKEC